MPTAQKVLLAILVQIFLSCQARQRYILKQGRISALLSYLSWALSLLLAARFLALSLLAICLRALCFFTCSSALCFLWALCWSTAAICFRAWCLASCFCWAAFCFWTCFLYTLGLWAALLSALAFVRFLAAATNSANCNSHD